MTTQVDVELDARDLFRGQSLPETWAGWVSQSEGEFLSYSHDESVEDTVWDYVEQLEPGWFADAIRAYLAPHYGLGPGDPRYAIPVTSEQIAEMREALAERLADHLRAYTEEGE